MASAASSSEAISTKPKPLPRPVALSVMTLADVTLPALAKYSCREASVIPKGRLPMKSLLPMFTSYRTGAVQEGHGGLGNTFGRTCLEVVREDREKPDSQDT